jgi:hypothetical protein
VVVASENGIENTMDLRDIMDMTSSTSSNSRLTSSMDQNLLPPTRKIHKVYTRKPRHKNVEQLFVQDQHQLLVSVNDSPTTPISHLTSSMDQNLLPLTRHIHKVYTRKPRHKNVEQLFVQDQHQLFVSVNDSPTTQTPGNLELPSGTHSPSDFDISIVLRKEVRAIVWNKGKVPQHLTLSLTISHLRHYHIRTKHLQPLYPLFLFHVIGEV